MTAMAIRPNRRPMDKEDLPMVTVATAIAGKG